MKVGLFVFVSFVHVTTSLLKVSILTAPGIPDDDNDDNDDNNNDEDDNDDNDDNNNDEDDNDKQGNNGDDGNDHTPSWFIDEFFENFL